MKRKSACVEPLNPCAMTANGTQHSASPASTPADLIHRACPPTAALYVHLRSGVTDVAIATWLTPERVSSEVGGRVPGGEIGEAGVVREDLDEGLLHADARQ